MRLLQCLYSAGTTMLASTTNQRHPSQRHDMWKIQAKLPCLWRLSHWYQPWEFPPLLMTLAHC